MRDPLVSCLCVTEDRPWFMPWLLWCFDRQTWSPRELVVVDSSRGPSALPERADVRVVPAPPGTRVAVKRNLALRAARGDVIAWFDDDDWQHPRRLELGVELLRGGAELAGPRAAWAVELPAQRAWQLRELSDGVLFNGAVFSAALARRFEFDPNRMRASDTHWLSALLRDGPPLATLGDCFFWLVHGRNLSLSRQRRVWSAFTGPSGLAAVRQSLGDAAWGDTGERLAALGQRRAAAEGGVS